MCTRLAEFVERSGGKLPRGPIAQVLAELPGSPLVLGPVPDVHLEDSGTDAKGCRNRLVLETAGTRREFDQPYGDRGPEEGWCPGISVATVDGQPVLIEPGYVSSLSLVAIREDARTQAEIYGPACEITLKLTPIAMGLDGRCDGPECSALATLAKEIAEHPVRQDRDTPTDPAYELSDNRWPSWLRRGRALAAANQQDWTRLAAEGESYVRLKPVLSVYGWYNNLWSNAWFHPVDLQGTLGLLVNGPIVLKMGGDFEVLAFVKRIGNELTVVASYPYVETLYSVDEIAIGPPR